MFSARSMTVGADGHQGRPLLGAGGHWDGSMGLGVGEGEPAAVEITGRERWLRVWVPGGLAAVS